MEKRVYSCATAHLDTVWNWTFEHTVADCLYNTLYKNFELFDKYPDYKFNFEGSYRYELFEEYYPEEFKKLKEYVKSGKWNVAGSAYENGDVNIPSPEALFRNILYGNKYFEKTFGKVSKDIYLPDCFGFGYALPSIIKHSNLLGFTTQKLTWGSAYATPFDIGRWYGVDGNYCFACLKPDSYSLSYKSIRDKKDNIEKIKENEEKYDLPWTFSFHGAGDQGGAPKEKSVKILQKEINDNENHDIKVISAACDKIYKDLDGLTEAQKDKLPSWNNELVMRDHGAGGYTSRAIGKRWNRKCEELCDMAERAAVIGTCLNAMDYPQNQLEKAWKRIIAHQFHDDLPGTSVLKAYQRSWNDYVLSLNQLEHEYAHSLGAIASVMDTSWVKGQAIIVSNSIENERIDVVKAKISLKSGEYLKAVDFNGKIEPVQVLHRLNDNQAIIAFKCSIPAVGFKVYDLQKCESSLIGSTKVYATQNTLENERYKVTLNKNGEISSIRDKKLNKELLKAPVRHEIIPYSGSISWPAWELTYKSVFSEKKYYPILESMHILYQGPVTSAIEVIQNYGNTKFKSIVSLNCGGDVVYVQNEIEWWEQKALLKDAFKLNVSNEYAMYDLGLGAIKRTNNSSKLFEVPAQKWVDISEHDFGISILNDSKYGWDKPDNNTVRMTVLHTPRRNYLAGSMQSHMEVGLNRYGFAIMSHDANLSYTQVQAKMFNQPLAGIITDSHRGDIKNEYSFVSISKDNVILRAMKKAEDSDEIVVRFNEGCNLLTRNIHFRIANGIEMAKSIYANEEIIGDAKVENGELIFDLTPYEVKSFALKLKPIHIKAKNPIQEVIGLEYNEVLFTKKDESAKPVINNYKKLKIPKELNPRVIKYNGLEFKLDDEKALICNGQKIKLNKKYQKLFILACSLNKDEKIQFLIDNDIKNIIIHSAFERIGKWDIFDLKDTANIKECSLAYEFTHMHNENGADVIAKQMLLFCYELDVENANEVTLPLNKDIVIFAATGVNNPNKSELLYPLYDRVPERNFKNKFNFKNRFISALSHLPSNAIPNVPLHKRIDRYKVK